MFKIFTRQLPGDEGVEGELNQFLLTHRVVSVQSQVVVNGVVPYWVWCVEYLGQGFRASNMPQSAVAAKVDYAQVLSPSEFSRFNALRDLRKTIATEEAVKPFVVFTNVQLAEIAKLNPDSIEKLKGIDGIGEARCQKYGERVLGVLSGIVQQETAGESPS